MDAKEKKLPRVAVLVVTYNQEQYIRECIESALHQQTIYPMDIIVGNDCSTDETVAELQRLEEEYPNRLIVFNRQKNMGLVENTIDLFRYILSHDYTYTAMLDGDDYWCDNEKIQRQVDLMEAHSDMAFCYMRATSNKQINNGTSAPQICIKDMFSDIRSTGISNGTVLHRNKFLRNVPFEKISAQHLLSMDYPTNVYMALQGKVAFIDAVSLYWRRDGRTVSSPRNKEKALRYTDHEVRQGLFLASEFPNSVYSFSKQEAEEYRAWQIYQWALSHKDYATIRECLLMEYFPKTWLKNRPERYFLGSKFNFYLYMYGGGRKMCTAMQLLKNKIKK